MSIFNQSNVYMQYGGENEYFYGWGSEEAEWVKFFHNNLKNNYNVNKKQCIFEDG